jgi:hypothetical protein
MKNVINETTIQAAIHIYIYSNNDRQLLTKTFIPLHYPSPNYTSLHFTTLVDTSLLPIKTSPNYTSLHFTTL